MRYYQITKGSTDNPDRADSWFIMTNLTGEILLSIATQYSLRMWIEYGFKQVKYELGWHDYRTPNYRSIERWWELVFSAYLLVSLHTEQFKHHQDPKSTAADSTPQPLPFRQHSQWESGITKEKCVEQPAITPTTVLVLGDVGSLGTGLSHSRTQTGITSVDGVDGYLSHSANPRADNCSCCLSDFHLTKVTKEG